jgi:F-type H+-transporting ATPase subunit a
LVRNEYISLWYFLFVFIYLSNIIGLIPYTFTLTSSFLITFYIAATYFIGINLIGVYRQKWYFVTIFLPNGALWHLAPFLVLIEVISHCAKVFSLSIRLFANMLAGHALLKILIGFAWSMCIVNPLFISISIIPWGIVTTVLCLETLIAFLQAYVFILLISIYLNDVLSGH